MNKGESSQSPPAPQLSLPAVPVILGTRNCPPGPLLSGPRQRQSEGLPEALEGPPGPAPRHSQCLEGSPTQPGPDIGGLQSQSFSKSSVDQSASTTLFSVPSPSSSSY